MTDTVILGSIEGVELVHAGTWELSSGSATFTAEDLAAAVDALQCPGVRNPVIKIGHRDDRFTDPMSGKAPGDGEPAIGWVGNLRVDAAGYRLSGDFLGMPQWIVEAAPSAWPDRSVEGAYDLVCQLGHTHPFVITGVALLGVTPPGVGTLESLQDVAALYGVNASTEEVTRRDFRLVLGGAMTRSIAASVSVEDVRRAFNEQAPWDEWIVEFTLDPLQIVVTNSEDDYWTRSVTVDDAAQTVTFGAPVEVVRAWAPAPAEPPEADESSMADTTVTLASARTVFASREESRPGVNPEDLTHVEASGQTAITIPGERPAPRSEKGAGMDPAKLRDALGLTAEASDADVQAGLVAAGLASPVSESPTPAPIPEGVTVIDSETLAGLQVAAAAGASADKKLRTQERDTAISAAVRVGKFPPSRRAHYETSWDADPEGTKAILASLAPGLVPVNATGYAGDPDSPEGGPDAEFDRLFRHETQEV
jgi:hypothetical protein